MKSLLLYLSICLAISTFGQQTINASITHDGMQRDYILYLPASYDGTTAVPLLFNFHGYTSNAQQQMFYGDFRPIADTANFIIAHPQGTLDGSGTTHFNVGFGGSTVDDVGFTSALLDTLIADYNINEDRVYSTGMSNGGYMSFHLACNLSSRIAAIGSVTGAMVPTTMANCNASHMTPVLQIHGTADATVPYNGGAWTEAIPDVLDHWATYNSLNPTPLIEPVPDNSSTDGSTAERFSYFDGNGCVKVLHYKITNGGHTWPGSAINLNGTNYDIDASTEVWRFVSQFDINGVISSCQTIGLDELSVHPYSVYPNPADDMISIDGLKQASVNAKLTNLAGQVVWSGQVSQLKNTIDISDLPSGSYQLILEDFVLRVLK